MIRFVLCSDLFNLPLAALWTAVLGDWDRELEENTEQRIPVESIIIHERFHSFQHDIGKIFLFVFKVVGEELFRFSSYISVRWD